MNKAVFGKIGSTYFMDTWDYKNGRYKPIFINKKIPDRPNYAVKSSGSDAPKYAVDSIIKLFL